MSTITVSLKDRTDKGIPIVGFGTGTALFGRDATQSALNAIKAGFRHLDGAQAYANEKSLGDAIAESGIPREELWVTTKLDVVPPGKNVGDTLRESLSKNKLNLGYVDLFLIHNPKQHPHVKDVWRQVLQLKKEGLARSVGVSNFTVRYLEQIVGPNPQDASLLPDVIQNEYHPYIAKAGNAVREYAKKHGIIFASYAGLTPIARFPNGPVTSVVERAAKRLSEVRGQPVTTGQVLQVWLRQQGIVVISTSNKEERLKEYLDVPNLPPLTEEEMQAIETEGAKEHHRVFMTWLEKEPPE
ncbi:hypothetical protein EIP91_005174 [Steccherinum ochraceum]|uniref:NADP-dependent oxidoreductase domain-containing protein n=1 Tax=Steccherinum ochraceum TaxID=92696 RepID=A0A4R0RAG7_9APHY|nr:hypothetical protein EIP91_005174 [Steccherinum ochraceum]